MGDTDLTSSLDAGERAAIWRGRMTAVYGSAATHTFYAGSAPTENPLELKLQMQMVSVAAAVDAPWGTTLALTVPWAQVEYERLFLTRQVEDGVGDVEGKVRQDVSRWLPTWLPRTTLGVGVVANTGPYRAKVEASALATSVTAAPSVSKEVSIGRGAWWSLAEVELFGQPWGKLGVFGSVQMRTPATDASDGFRWGAETRAGGGLRHAIVERWLSAVVQADWQWRGRASEVTVGERVPFLNAGGHWLNVTPTLMSALWPWLTVAASWRQPLWRDVVGVQGVQEPSLYLSVSGSFSGAPAPPVRGLAEPSVRPGDLPEVPEIAALVVAGKSTLIDYWASWCEPCQRLASALEAAIQGRTDVIVRRVDATQWEAAEWKHYLPDAAGLPVLDVYGPDRRLRARLTGEATFGFGAHLLPALCLPADGTPVAWVSDPGRR
ncbi:MAG: thioredoxin [Myxococcales bacterium]|nr:thioredoxin [Myxococcales bacterium]